MVRRLRGAGIAIVNKVPLPAEVLQQKGASGMEPLYTPWQEMLETSDVISCTRR